MVTLPAVGGQIGIYPDHVPVITPLVPGEIIVPPKAEPTGPSWSVTGSPRSARDACRS